MTSGANIPGARGVVAGRRRRRPRGGAAGGGSPHSWNRVRCTSPGASNRALREFHGVRVGGAARHGGRRRPPVRSRSRSRRPRGRRGSGRPPGRPTSTSSIMSACAELAISSVARPASRMVTSAPPSPAYASCSGIPDHVAEEPQRTLVVLRVHDQPELLHRHGTIQRDESGPRLGSFLGCSWCRPRTAACCCAASRTARWSPMRTSPGLTRTSPGLVALVDTDGSVRVAAEGLAFPNGMAISPDGSTLVVAESYGEKLTAYPIADDGTLRPCVHLGLDPGRPPGRHLLRRLRCALVRRRRQRALRPPPGGR